jgi:hypothetical protein
MQTQRRAQHTRTPHALTRACSMIAALCCVWACVSGEVQAQDGPPPPTPAHTWHLEAEALTDVAIQVGGQVNVELPHRVRVSTSLGVLPEPYVKAINGFVTAVGGYSEDTGALIEQVLKNSLVWKLQVGWRPWQERGFYFDLGYGLVTLGGGLTGQEVITLATGRDVPQGAQDARLSYHVASTLHLITGEVGWRWLVWEERLLLRTSLGFIATVAASTEASPESTPRTPQGREASAQLSQYVSDYLDDIYTSYVFSPTVSVGIGWRFF